MSAKELIKLLKDCPQDLPIIFKDKWIEGIEVSKTGESGYEVCGEIRLIKEEK
jgi:hypothetical protein